MQEIQLGTITIEVTQKDIKSSIKIGLTKRSSSKTKGVSNEKTGPVHALVNLGKDVKDEIEN